jgi:DNA-binding NarL/FixJ family response regulator
LKKILLSVQNNLLSEAIQNALVKKGRFCIENVSPNQDGKILDLCIAERVDVLLMDVTRLAIQLLRNGLSFVEK